MIQTALNTFGKLDIVVHVAGILRDRMIFNMSEEEWDDVIRVHLKGTFNVCQPATALMRQQKSGRIICFSSVSAAGNTGQANYAAAKAGILGICAHGGERDGQVRRHRQRHLARRRYPHDSVSARARP